MWPVVTKVDFDEVVPVLSHRYIREKVHGCTRRLYRGIIGPQVPGAAKDVGIDASVTLMRYKGWPQNPAWISRVNGRLSVS